MSIFNLHKFDINLVWSRIYLLSLFFIKEGTLLVDCLQTLVYIELDPTQEDVLVKDASVGDDVGVTKGFDS